MGSSEEKSSFIKKSCKFSIDCCHQSWSVCLEKKHIFLVFNSLCFGKIRYEWPFLQIIYKSTICFTIVKEQNDHVLREYNVMT